MMKAAFFDLDGTLVAYGKPGMSAQLREDMFELRRRGIKTVLATGRGKHDLKNIGMLGDVEFDAYVTFNGYCCYDEADQNCTEKQIFEYHAEQKRKKYGEEIPYHNIGWIQ